MCYTSGTTGRSKGVVYSHRALVLHSMATAMAGSFGISAADIVLAVDPDVPRQRLGTAVHGGAHRRGAGLPRPAPRPRRAARALPRGARHLQRRRAHRLARRAGACSTPARACTTCRALRTIVIGGAAAPEALVRGLEERHGLRVHHVLGHDGDRPGRHARHAHARGRGAAAGGAARAPDEGGRAWRAARAAGAERGTARCRGTASRWASSRCAARTSRRPTTGRTRTAAGSPADGWFRTGDIATIDPRGYLEIRDRTKDLIKSGGEWISSVALEGALMGHPAVAEAAVVAVPHPRWLERPLAAVVLREGRTAAPAELLAHLARTVSGLVAPRRHRVRPGHPADVHRQVPQVRPSRLAARALRRGLSQARGDEPPPRPLGAAGDRPSRRFGARAREHAARVRAGRADREPTPSSWTCGSAGTARRW